MQADCRAGQHVDPILTAAAERARWRRALDNRCDDRRVDAYASYAQAVNDMISLASRIAAARGIVVNHEPLPPIEENLELLTSAGVTRAIAWETVLLLGHPDTVAAARNWHETVWRLEGFARGRVAGKPEDWEEVRTEVNRARSAFYESARKDLRVGGGALPGIIDFEARMRRIAGNAASGKTAGSGQGPA
jgi:hypothetical protein